MALIPYVKSVSSSQDRSVIVIRPDTHGHTHDDKARFFFLGLGGGEDDEDGWSASASASASLVSVSVGMRPVTSLYAKRFGYSILWVRGAPVTGDFCSR